MGLVFNPFTGTFDFTGSGTGGGGAPADATYITQVPDASLTNEQALSLLATGILKSTTVTGVVSIAAAGTDYTDAAFKTIQVSGQSDVVADGPADTLTLVAGTNITLTTNAGADSVTITAASGGGTIGGSIAATQVAFGSGVDTIEGEAAFTYIKATNLLHFISGAGIAFEGEAAPITAVGGGDGFADTGLLLDCTDGYFFLQCIAQADLVVKNTATFRTKNANSTFFHTTSLSAGSTGLANLNTAVGLFGSLNVGSAQAFTVGAGSTDATAIGLLGLTQNAGTTTESVAIGGIAKATANSAPVWGALAVVTNDTGLTNTKLVGMEIDVQPIAGSTVTASGGLFINAFNVASVGPALQTGGISSGTWTNGLVIEQVASGGAQILATAVNGADCIVVLRADNNDDATDAWTLKALATGNSLTWTNNSNVLSTLTTAGLFTVPTVQPSTGYNAVDGTAGVSGTGGFVTTKNGLVTTLAASMPQVAGGADAAQTMAANTLYVVDISGYSANRTYTLPATAAVGDRVGIMLTAGDNAFFLLITANTGDTLNGIAGGTEWSRLILTGECVIMQCVAANATWIVEVDGRIPLKCSIQDASKSQTMAHATDTKQTMDATVFDNSGYMADLANERIKIPRAGWYQVQGEYQLTALTAAGILYAYLFKNGAYADPTLANSQYQVATNYPITAASGSLSLAVGDYMELYGAQYTAVDEAAVASALALFEVL